MSPPGGRALPDRLGFNGFGLTFFAPLPAAMQFPERKEFLALPALALDFRQPSILSTSESGNVSRNLIAAEANEAIPAQVLFNGISVHLFC